MRLSMRLIRPALALALLITSCQQAAEGDDGDPNRPGADGGQGGSSDGGAAGSGLPCDVASLLRARCLSCHGSPLAGGAPNALLTYDDLARPSPLDQTQSVAARSLARMQDAARPMPPGTAPSVPAAELDSFRAWVQAGLPRGSCGGAPDGGSNDPLNAPPRCTSGTSWTQGDAESPLMHPGGACITCHTQRRKGPSLHIGGTVYPSGHEPDECYGQGSAMIEVTDAQGRLLRLTSNASGNFLYETRRGLVSFPIKVKVVYMGRERAMAGAAMSGDCNSCHTQTGASGAPGRVTLP